LFAFINKALSRGYLLSNVKEIAEGARNGEEQLLDIFFETGEQLGELIEIKKKLFVIKSVSFYIKSILDTLFYLFGN
jgi:hypothetical protein